MKKTLYIVLLALLTASCDDDITPRYTVGEADNAIVLGVGMSDGRAGVLTRAGAEDNHVKHLPFAEDTKALLRVDGTWVGHGTGTVSQTTTATIGVPITEEGDNKNHNNITFYSPNIYWDDYGTADPDNSDGRNKGLTIYGVAVDGVTTALPAPSNWKSMGWELSTDQAVQGWINEDLLTSNNVTSVDDPTTVPYSVDGTYKFNDRASGKLLEFTHAMTKITVELTAGDGFRDSKFVSNPSVTLKSFYYKGNVNVEDKSSSKDDDKKDITMHLDGGGASNATATFNALVFPGNEFENTDQILTLTADGNTFNVTAAKLNAAIQKAIDGNATTGYPIGSSNLSADPKTYDLHLLQAWNYVLKIKVNKTDISITATIKDWDNVTADEEAPKINISYTYGHEPGTDMAKGFDLYRSQILTGSYISGETDGNHAVVSYADSKYTMAPQLYWPNHQTHYFFRGVWPLVDSKDGSEAQLGPTAAQVKANAVDVENVAYKPGYYPSDLMIGRPLNVEETETDEQCKVDAHKDGSGNNPAGICATTGDIRMNFRYMMSQVKVELTSSDADADDHIAFDAKTKVEIIGGYKDGAIKLSDCTSDFSEKTVDDYQLHNKANDDYDSYHDAIIPQTLTDGMKFRITVTNSDNSTDTYETVIKNIKVKEGSADPALITAWASGKAYTYNLKITKTAIKVTATLTDWVTVTGSDDVWF